jgi:predicted nucleic acid-binding protein
MKVDLALENVKRLFLDSGAVIYYVERNPSYLAVMDRIFDSLDGQQFQAVTSPVTLAECLVLPIRENDIAKQQVFTEILTLPEMADFVGIDAGIANQAAIMRVRYNFKLPDALQIATAIASNCDGFLTNDIQLKRVVELQILVISELEI